MRLYTKILLLGAAFWLRLYGKTLTRQIVLLGHTQTHKNPEYGDVIITMTKPNRKTFNLNITTIITKPINEMQIKAQVYKFVDGSYKKTALRYDADACVFFNTVCQTMFQFKTLKEVFKDYITSCPVKPGKYYLYNVNETFVRVSFLPTWRGKIEYSFLTEKTLMYGANAFFEVIEIYKD